MAERTRQPYSSHAQIPNPIPTRVEGKIPSWLNGNVVRVGPGLFDFGKHTALYPMDGMGLLHSFQIQDGQVTFRSKYIASDIMKKNSEAERFVAAEFGTPVSPDPKASMFSKLKSKVTGSGELSDNATHNVCYWKENKVLLVVGHPLFVIDPNNLDTIDKMTLPDKMAIDLVTEHVHIDKDGTLYLFGSHVRGKPAYHVVKVPATGDVKTSFQAAEIVFTVNGQFAMTPTSHHNFIMTDNFFCVIECPLEINVLKILTKGTVLEALKWEPSVTSKFHLYNRKTGTTIKQKMEADSFYLVHTPNAYEDGDHLVIDMLLLNKFTVKDLFVPRKELASPEYRTNKRWLNLDIDKAKRFVLPTNTEAMSAAKVGDNLVRLENEDAEAIVEKSHLHLKHRAMTAPRDEVEHLQYPCINPEVKGKQYKYFYAGGYGESEFLQFGIGKYDVITKEVVPWEAKTDQYLSEPVFVADPQGTAEDDGVLLFNMLDYVEEKDRLVIVDAKTMTTLAQVYIEDQSNIPVLVPEADHAVFIPTTA